ncbi:unnamed protein product, partial [Staurois parvus]
MASRDTQPQTVCKVPQQQLPGHSAADRVQGCSVDRLTDLHGLAGSQLRRLMQSCSDSQPWGIAEGYSPDLLGVCRVRRGDGWGGSIPLTRASQHLSGSKMIPAA